MALQLVALDLAESEQRGRGLAALPGVLWREGTPVQTFPRLGVDRAAYLQQLLPHTTAAEQARILAAAAAVAEHTGPAMLPQAQCSLLAKGTSLGLPRAVTVVQTAASTLCRFC